MMNQEQILDVINKKVSRLEIEIDKLKNQTMDYLSYRLNASTNEEYEQYDHLLTINGTLKHLMEEEIKTLNEIKKLI